MAVICSVYVVLKEAIGDTSLSFYHDTTESVKHNEKVLQQV